LHDLVESSRSQLVIATHSPILIAYPGATIYHLGAEGIRSIAYEDTEHFRITRDFLHGRESFFRHLFATSGDAP
jgi:predicted ATPase